MQNLNRENNKMLEESTDNDRITEEMLKEKEQLEKNKNVNKNFIDLYAHDDYIGPLDLNCAIESLYRLHGMLDSIIDNGLGITLAICKTYRMDYFDICYNVNNNIDEIQEKIKEKYIQNNENNLNIKLFGNYLIKVCKYAKQLENQLFNEKEISLNPFKVEDLVRVILGTTAEQTDGTIIPVGAESLEEWLIDDFVDNIEYDI